ncbi:MAG: hypothetical protein HY892_02720 [Deltaproteobacteria bacterium]|nr:hypothetical protein [Deltaproteobacteria bacterium]
MKYSKGAAIFILFWIWVLAAGAERLSAQTAAEKSTLQGVKQEVAETYQAVKNFSVKQKDEAVKKSKNLMDDLDARMEALEGNLDKKWDQMDQKARETSRATMKSLRKQRDQVAERYYELKYSSGKAWEGIKKGFIDSYRAISDSFSKAAKEF